MKGKRFYSIANLTRAISFLMCFYYLIVAFSSCNNIVNQTTTQNEIKFLKDKYKAAYIHYKKPQDSLKLKALDFLVNNMYDQYHFEGRLLDEYDILVSNCRYPTVEYLQTTFDSLKNKIGNDIHVEYDSNLITNEFLIKNIDESFECWNTTYEGKKLSFEEFCEYILPYKLENERPENWHGTLMKRFKYLGDSLGDTTNRIKTVNLINLKLNGFKILLDYDFPVDIDFNMAAHLSVGTCYTATKYVAYPMRALDIPVVVDYTIWGNRSSGHYWNAVIYKGKPYPFDPVESPVGFYKIQFTGMDKMIYKPTKIFRKTYSVQSNSLPLINANNEFLPPSLAKLRIKDVTADYIPVSNVTLNLIGSYQNNHISYICSFDNKKWNPVYWGVIQDDKVVFKDMGRDVVYLPCIVANFNYKYFGNPFILTKEGATVELKPDFANKIAIRVNRKYPEDDSNKILAGDRYELLYWCEGWKSLGTQTAEESFLTFYNAPGNALYWIRDLTRGKQERIFSYINNKQQWW